MGPRCAYTCVCVCDSECIVRQLLGIGTVIYCASKYYCYLL